MNNPFIPHVTVDALIAQRLPSWLAGLPQEQRSALRQALVLQQQAEHRLQQMFGAVTPLEAFAENLLGEAMTLITDEDIDVRGARLLSVWHEPVAPLVASLPLTWRTHRSEQTLLAAALHNFSEEESRAEAFHAGTHLTDDLGETIKAFKPEQYAWLCRQLDIGGQYQRYLKTHFEPEAAEPRQQLEQQLEAVHRANFDAAVQLALAKGQLDALSGRQLRPLLSPIPLVALEPALLVPRQLHLLGKRAIGVVTLEVRRDAAPDATLEGVIAWVPGDPHGAVSRHASWNALYRAFAQRFRQPGYPAFFKRFLAQGDHIAFERVLAGLLAEKGLVELDGRHLDFDGELFVRLRQDQVGKILGDARVLAVPTDDEDRRSRSERLESYLNAGLGLLNLAALFVPGLGLAMLGVAALEIAKEVYEGYEDWRIGDREGALNHLFGVAENVAANALLLAGGVAVGKVLQRVHVVDELVPVVGADGEARLCHPELEGYRVEDSEEDALGEVIDNFTWQHVRTHEGSFAVQPHAASDTWQLRHPQRPAALPVALRDNGAGAWRHALESPQHWQGARLLRRLGRDLADIPESTMVQVLETTGFDEARLRRLHLEDAPTPARLLDALERLQLHEQQPALRGDAFDMALTARQAPAGEAARLLRRDFPGLTVRCAEEIAEQASTGQLEQMTRTSRVPLLLAEQARWALRDSRLDRACAGLRQASAMNADGERLAFGLLDTLSPWADGIRVVLHDGQASGPQLLVLGKADALDARRIVKGAGGYQAIAADGRALAADNREGSLVKALLLHMEPVQHLNLGSVTLSEGQLADALAARAASQREEAARLLGLAPVGGGVRPPVRLGDGRLGYPLSGRAEGGRQALRHALRQIHPELGDAELDAFIAEQLQRQVNLWDHVTELLRQLPQLEQQLATWRRGAIGRSQQVARKRMAKYLLRSWRHQALMLEGEQIYMSIESERVGAMPDLPASVRFDNVTRLTLRNLDLDSLNPAFFGRFGRLQRLDLRGNRLTGLPATLEGLDSLQELELADNRIVLGPENRRRLERLGQLRRLNLNRNPLVAAPRLEGLSRLRHVSLRGTGLTQVPQGLAALAGLEYADLRGNRIVTLDNAFFGLPSRSIERIHLHDNPLDLRSEARLSAFLQAEPHRLRRLVGHTDSTVQNRDAWLQLLEPDDRLLRGIQWDSLMHEPGAADFYQLLADLRATEDFIFHRGDLTARVWRVIESCVGNTGLRERLFELAGHPRTCSDSVALNFSLLEVQSWVYLRTAGQTGPAAERSLQRLGRSLFRLDEVDRAASEEIARRAARGIEYDEVEIRLMYRVGLAQSLDLPGQPSNMRFPTSAEVSHRSLVAVRSQVLIAERTPRLMASVAQREFWQTHLRETYAQRFEDTDQPFYEQLEQLQQAALPEGEYLSGTSAVAEAREAAMQTLIETLTQEIFVRNPL
ncbi:NEL-type E3 ubiquitin ligase domain-containing protein [Pseudomonas sp. zfem004]|uniref:NEL-type E3 ubiquitin ligase domain-containing protein n=1 Tax=Pseudomonas sp. zfem004 TaxID=3078199 RepID=UPI002927DB98|nr:NEL-type E3 ubiquitin ligase domain-containing protein [Pseudomonas sp. zfem004]MDU9402007.1 NEL-type E3 ubiquitin ligase domain-containing protein [Pseudomonas sp. zfem004]